MIRNPRAPLAERLRVASGAVHRRLMLQFSIELRPE
jgi:hypothetical protein